MTSGVIVMPNNLSVMQEKGQITVPTEIRKKLGLKKGDYVAFVETEHGVLIAPREVIAMEALEKLGVMLKDKGITLEELMESADEIRGVLVKEMYGLDAEA